MPFWLIPSGLFLAGTFGGYHIGQEFPEEDNGVQDDIYGAIDWRTWLLGGVAIYVYLNKDKKRTKTTHTKGWRTTATDLYSAKKW